MEITIAQFIGIKGASGEFYGHDTVNISGLSKLMQEFESLKQLKRYVFIPKEDISATTLNNYVLVDLDRAVVIGTYSEPFGEPQLLCGRSLGIIEGKADIDAEPPKKRMGRPPNNLQPVTLKSTGDFTGVETLEKSEHPLNPHIINENTLLDFVAPLLTKRAVNGLCDGFKKGLSTPLKQIAKLHPADLLKIKGFGQGALNSLAALFERYDIFFATKEHKYEDIIKIFNFEDE